MAKYLVLWEIDSTKIPVSPQERAAMWGPMTDMVRQDMKKGISKDWGVFVGEVNGYAIAEGTEVEVSNMIQQYVPFVHFEVHHVMSVEQADEVTQALAK